MSSDPTFRITNIKNNSIQNRVHPCLVPSGSIISKVKNELNTVVLDGNLADKIILIGKGAGQNPTASAVLNDIIDYSKPKKKKLITEQIKNIKYKKIFMHDRKGRFYIRVVVLDSPGVLADITAFFKRKKISISSMFQLEKKLSTFVQLVFVTHQVNEKQLILAILLREDCL